MPEYSSPEASNLTEDHVRSALDFLVAVEPEPPPESREEYEAATEPYHTQISAAMVTLRKFAEEAQPASLEQMQKSYYGFTNDPRYLATAYISSVVCGSLNEAWEGVGPWRR